MENLLPMPPGTDPDAKCCTTCFRREPDAKFSLSKGYKRNTCDTCRLTQRRQAAVEERQKRLRAGIGKLVSAALDETVRTPALRNIAAEMLDRYGGLGNFCEVWKDILDKVVKDQPKANITFRHLMGLLRILEEAAKEQQGDVEIAALSDEELELAIGDYVGDRFGLKIADEEEPEEEDVCSA